MWYEDLNFIENPFGEQAGKDLVGVRRIIEDLLYNVDAGNIVLVEGDGGRGKTSLLKEVITKFRGAGKVVYINGERIDNPDIEKVLINKYGFFGKLFNQFPKNMILLMDEVGNLDGRNLERIKYFYDQNYIKSIIFTSKKLEDVNFSLSLKDRVTKTIKLEKLREEDAIKMIKSRMGDVELFSRKDIKMIFEGSEGNLKIFLNKCEGAAKLAVERKLDKINEEIVKEVLGKKKKSKEATKKKTKKEARKNPKKESKRKNSSEGKQDVKPEGQIKVIYDDVAEQYY